MADVEPMTVEKFTHWMAKGRFGLDDDCENRDLLEEIRKALERGERLAGLFERERFHSLDGCELEFRDRYGGWVIHPDKDADWDVMDAVVYDSAIEALEAADALEAEKENTSDK